MAKVVHLEDARAELGGSTLELGRMDLNEPAFVKSGTEQVAQSRLETEDCLGGVCSETENTVGQTGPVWDMAEAAFDAIFLLGADFSFIDGE